MTKSNKYNYCTNVVMYTLASPIVKMEMRQFSDESFLHVIEMCPHNFFAENEEIIITYIYRLPWFYERGPTTCHHVFSLPTSCGWFDKLMDIHMHIDLFPKLQILITIHFFFFLKILLSGNGSIIIPMPYILFPIPIPQLVPWYLFVSTKLTLHFIQVNIVIQYYY